MEENGRAPLDGVLVVERAGRLAGAVCAGLLLQLGARVIRSEAPDDPEPLDLTGAPLANLGAFVRAGKERVIHHPAAFAELLEQADIAVVAPPPGAADFPELAQLRARESRLIGCVLTPFGLAGPVGGMPASGDELFLQAVSGMMAVTGQEGGPPLPNGVPLAEMLGGLNAAAAALAALAARERGAGGQLADIALFDGLIGLLGACMPLVLAGTPDGFRMGCRHPMTAPWNVYPTADAAVIVCMSTDRMWERLLGLMGRAEFLGDRRFASPALRRGVVDEVDRIVAGWSRGLTTAEVTRLLEEAGIPAGAALTIPELVRDESFLARGMVRQVTDEDGSKRTLAGPVINFSRSATTFADTVTPLREAPQGGGQSGAVKGGHAAARSTPVHADAAAGGALPLAGLKVVELGVFTAGPVSARHLASLGASVVKVEPPGGESTRAWEPAHQGIGHYFANANCDKQSLGLDLKHEQGKRIFLQLCAGADVLVENMRPGSLDKLGIGYDTLKEVNPGLVFFSLSGYGRQGPLAGKAAYDTVIQAATGILGLVGGKAPVKLGVSIADMMGAQFAPLAILAALRARERDGRGERIDIAMRDSTAWLTQFSWPAGQSGLPPWEVLEAGDGFVVVRAAPGQVERKLPAKAREGKTARALAEAARAAGLDAERVLEPGEVLAGAQVAARGLLPKLPAAGGTTVRVLEGPLRLEKTPGRVRGTIGKPGADNGAILAGLGYGAAEIEALLAAGAIHAS